MFVRLLATLVDSALVLQAQAHVTVAVVLGSPSQGVTYFAPNCTQKDRWGRESP